MCCTPARIGPVTDSWLACHEFEPGTGEDPPCRRGRCTVAEFDILPWLANSLDVNNIEHLWDLIGRDMNRGSIAQTVNDLRTAVDETWKRLFQSTINRLIDGMSFRIEACIAVQGGDIGC
ncbi:hypothetical protein TNCV_3113731 [Trichonephila clavipes]|nr:hypothetical protein TNCV_3113731 [Trichonephila clavipes]